VTAGEFAFAVGTGAGAVADRAQSDEPVPAAAVLGGWLLFVGLAVAVGALLAERRLPVGLDEATFLRLLTRGGLLLAIGGAGASGLPAVAATRAASASGIAVGATVAALTVTLLVAERPGVRTWALAPAVAAAAAWSARSHASAYGGLLVTTNNAVHLAAASAWVGLLAVVVAVLWRARQRRDLQLRLVRGYAAPALWLVIVVAGSGVASATTLLTDLTDLAATRYGWALTVKVALVAVAIAMALAARTWGLGAGHIRILRRLATSELTVLTAVLLATATLTSFSPPIAAAATELLLGPPPITGPTARAAGMAGNLNVAVLAGDDQLQVEVFGPSGPVPGTDAEVSATLPDGWLAELRPRPCGDGCSVLRYALPDGTTEVTVDAGAPDWTGGRFVGDLSWPPPATRPELLREVVTAMRDVPTLTLTEQVSSGPNAVGPRTTTELSGKRYLELSPYGSGEAVDIRPLAEISDAVVLALPGSRMLVTLWLDDQRRVIRERIVSPGHVISRTISYPP
jgi:putative copper export protein